MQRLIFSAAILIVQMFLAGLLSLPAQEKTIAVTIDDLPLNGAQFEAARLQVMTNKLLAGIKEFRVPAVGFVNESLLYVPHETEARIAILKLWADAGVELGNHTFSHLGFKGAALADYEDDFIRGETMTKMLLKDKSSRPRYFRHPFLQMGDTLEAEREFESFIARRGYKIAPVTIDTLDWMFLAAYAQARASGNQLLMKRVSDEYLKYVGLKFDYCEKISGELFGRQIKQILLLHANELNADNIEALLKLIKSKGYRFITLEEALQDSLYKFPGKYAPTSDWLALWAFSEGKSFNPPAAPEYIQKIYNGK